MKVTDLKIIDLLSEKVIASDLKADNKSEVLEELVDLLYQDGKIKDQKKATCISSFKIPALAFHQDTLTRSLKNSSRWMIIRLENPRVPGWDSPFVKRS